MRVDRISERKRERVCATYAVIYAGAALRCLCCCCCCYFGRTDEKNIKSYRKSNCRQKQTFHLLLVYYVFWLLWRHSACVGADAALAFPHVVVVVVGAAFTFWFFGKRTQQIYVTPLVAWLWHCWISTGDGSDDGDGGGGGGCSRGGVFSLFYLSVALGVVVDGARTREHGKSHSLTKCEIQKYRLRRS